MNEIVLIGKKIGMTREFLKSGQSVPVTVVKMEKGRVIQIIDTDKRGYKAIQIGFGNIKASKLSKSQKGYFAKKNTEPKRVLKEFKVKDIANYKEGNELGLEIFNETKFVDVRSHGSTGQRQDPGKVFKNKKMAGHMGDKIRTIQNIEIIKSDIGNNLLYLKGSIPGSKNSQVIVKEAVKNISKLTLAERIDKQEKMRKIPDKKKK